jgi:hypothetical protein
VRYAYDGTFPIVRLRPCGDNTALALSVPSHGQGGPFFLGWHNGVYQAR